jgi:FixJ family two-component response regulator
MSRKVRISVVDDEASVRKALWRLLSASNLDAETFPSGQAFLDSLPSRSPDCLVLDLHMPGLSGLEVLQRLSSAGVTLPTIVITAYDEPDAQMKCSAFGASAYLRKPLDDKMLLATIASALELTVPPMTQIDPRGRSTPAKVQP